MRYAVVPWLHISHTIQADIGCITSAALPRENASRRDWIVSQPSFGSDLDRIPLRHTHTPCLDAALWSGMLWSTGSVEFAWAGPCIVLHDVHRKELEKEPATNVKTHQERGGQSGGFPGCDDGKIPCLPIHSSVVCLFLASVWGQRERTLLPPHGGKEDLSNKTSQLETIQGKNPSQI
ncbi:hypothetical protein L209DRAFT_16212 [Thermothelomyces heterothallicus CBS 203.75]